jgi:hypothetical protein
MTSTIKDLRGEAEPAGSLAGYLQAGGTGPYLAPAEAAGRKPDVMFTVINGTFRNLGPRRRGVAGEADPAARGDSVPPRHVP